MNVHLTTWEWVGASVWLFFGFVAVTMLPSRPKLSPLVRFTLFVFHLALLCPFGLFAFAMMLDDD